MWNNIKKQNCKSCFKQEKKAWHNFANLSHGYVQNELVVRASDAEEMKADVYKFKKPHVTCGP